MSFVVEALWFWPGIVLRIFLYSIDFRRPSPFGVKPSQNPQSADLDRARGHDLHAPEIGVIDGCDVYRPDDTTGGNQAAQSLFRANTQTTLALGLLGRLGNRNYRNESVLGINVAFAARIPIDEVAFV